MINWVKSHIAVTVLLVIVGYFLLSALFGINLLRIVIPSSRSLDTSYGSVAAPSAVSELSYGAVMPRQDGGIAADVPVADRLVVQNSNLSLLVKDVKQAGEAIIKHAEESGGFMVSTSYSRPEESAFATITVRVPSAKLSASLEYFRSLSIKVTNENLMGTDVTDQYVDIESRLASLELVKTKFESILASATQVQDILTVQRELIGTQTQMDNLKGQKQALEENANFAKLTAYLSTDELSLPYTPDTKFRPDVVFKLAVRSVLNTLRLVGEVAIWLGVYAIIWVPALILVIIYTRWKKRKVKLL